MGSLGTTTRLAAAVLATVVAEGAYLIEIDTDGTNDAPNIIYSPDFAFGAGTAPASVSAPSSAIGLTGGNSIFGGSGSPDTYFYTHTPDTQADNLFLAPGTPLGNGDFATGATGGGPGRYAIYATWPMTTNVDGGLTHYQTVTGGDGDLVSIDQNGPGGSGLGNVWVKIGEVDYTSGPITVTQTPTISTFVSMRAGGLLFELISGDPGGGYEGPPGPLIFGEGTQRFFGLAFERDKALAQTHHHTVLRSTDMENWSTTDLKVFSVTNVDAATELVTFHSMTPMAGQPREFLKVEARPKMPLGDPPKYCAITFDDGPHATNTPALLDILAARNIRATFYLVGNRVPLYPEIVRRMINEGHEVGNHSNTHTNLTTLSDEDVILELASCRDAIVAAATIAPATMRPPGGNRTPQLETLWLTEFGYPTIMWDVDPQDWNDAEVSDQQVIDTILTETDHGEIILCHDLKDRTIPLMPTVLDGLLADGFSFVTISELLELRGP